MTVVKINWTTETRDNNDGEDSDGPYSYRGTTDTWVTDVNAYLTTDSGNTWRGWGNSDEHECDTKPGDVVYAVMVQYSTGDSFGHDNGARIECMDVFNNPEDAVELAGICNNFERDCEKGMQHGVSRFSFDWKGKNYHVGWTGYFESLDRVWVETLVVGV